MITRLNIKSHTTCSQRNCRNHSQSTEPGKISIAIIPSTVSAGRTKYHIPRMNVARWTHGTPLRDLPLFCWPVLLSTELSSRKTNRSGLLYCAILPSQIACKCSSCSVACLETFFWLMFSLLIEWCSVATETHLPQFLQRQSWSSSRNRQGSSYRRLSK